MKGFVCVAGALLFSFLAGGQNPAPDESGPKRPMTFEDMMKMRRLMDIAVSPDGKWVLFSATDVDLEKNTKTSHLWIVPVAGGEERPLTISQVGESRGRFSPDGRQIAYLTARDGSQQIWLADFDGTSGTMGASRQLTHISTEADNVTWSPDGKHILFTSAVYPECGAAGQSGAISGSAEDDCDKRRDDEEKQSKVKARIFTALLYRHWNAFTDDKRSHLFLASVDDGSFRDLNPGDTHDVPPFSLGEPDGWGFSPDGKEVAFEEKKVDDPALSTNVSIFALQLDDPNAQPVKVSTSPGGNFTPRYSPDGKYIAWRMQKRAGYESDRFRLVLYDRATKQIRELLPNFDRWVDEEVWGPDSKIIYFTAGNEGEEPVYQLNLAAARRQAVRVDFSENGPGEYSDLRALPSSTYANLIAVRMTVQSPSEVVKLATTSRSGLNVTHGKNGKPDTFNDWTVFETQAIPVSHLNDRPPRPARPAQDGVLLVSPPKTAQRSRASSSGRRALTPQKIPRQIPDPRRTGGRLGRRVELPLECRALCRQRLRSGDDQYARLNGLRAGLCRWRERRLGRQTFHRFDDRPRLRRGALPIHRQDPRVRSRRKLWRIHGQLGAGPHRPLQVHRFARRHVQCRVGLRFDRRSTGSTSGSSRAIPGITTGSRTRRTPSASGRPRSRPKAFKTPTLVVHGQLDYRLDVSEGFQLFDTLQLLGVPSKMLYFPDEGHWVLKPQNSQLWYKTVNDWVDQWTHTRD